MVLKVWMHKSDIPGLLENRDEPGDQDFPSHLPPRPSALLSFPKQELLCKICACELFRLIPRVKSRGSKVDAGACFAIKPSTELLQSIQLEVLLEGRNWGPWGFLVCMHKRVDLSL